MYVWTTFTHHASGRLLHMYGRLSHIHVRATVVHTLTSFAHDICKDDFRVCQDGFAHVDFPTCNDYSPAMKPAASGEHSVSETPSGGRFSRYILAAWPALCSSKPCRGYQINVGCGHERQCKKPRRERMCLTKVL